MGDGRYVQEQIRGTAEGRVHDHRIADAASVRMLLMVRPRDSSSVSARAERIAMSSQTGWPEGASAEWGRDMPSASPILAKSRPCRGIGNRRRGGAGVATEIRGLLE